MRNAAFEAVDGSLQRLLGRDAGLDAMGNVCLEFRDGIRLWIELPDDHSTGFMHAEVTSPADDAVIRKAMEMNLFRVSPAGAWLAADAASGVISLCAPLVADTPETLDLALTGFLDGVATARSALSGKDGPRAAAAAASEGTLKDETFFLRL